MCDVLNVSRGHNDLLNVKFVVSSSAGLYHDTIKILVSSNDNSLLASSNLSSINSILRATLILHKILKC